MSCCTKILAALWLLCAPAGGMDPATTVWFDRPAGKFTQSLPLGNGRLGFMVFGGVAVDRIVLNEESMWSGSPYDDNRPDAHQNLPKIRELLLEGKNAEAEQWVNRTFTCRGKGSNQARGAHVPFGCYQVLGNLWLTFEGAGGKPAGYRRELDLGTGVAEVQYRLGSVNHRRRYFTSAADQVGVIHLSADKPSALTFSVKLDRPERFATRAVGSSELLMTGQLDNGQGGGGVRYAARLRVVPSGGKVTAGADGLRVAGADSALIFLAGETDYHGVVPRKRRVDDPAARTASVLEAAAARAFDELLAAHVAEHRRWFDRVSLVLDDGKSESRKNGRLPTDRRLEALAKGGADPALAALYFNFGRYLLIGSSRPGTLPANLQGIWAEEIQTPWNGDWHLDINVQMNYWPAEVCNLGECHQPLMRLIESLQAPGRKTARAYYDARGWVAHVITNCWGFTAPGERASWGSTASGSAWLCEHLWEHYAFTGDTDHLRWAYPILKGSALFYLEMLIEEPDHGWLVTAPSNSPENAFRTPSGKTAHTCMGPAMDMQILRELFGNCIRASEILGVDQEFRKQLAAKRARLAPNQIGPDGRLQEWLEPYEEPEPHHRHVSHMYGVYPYGEITPEATPKLAAAAGLSLRRRGFQGDVGWSNAWKAILWARLGDRKQGFWYLHRLISRNAFPNLFDAIWPGRTFQIDANFGGTAAVAEMLLQSHEGEIHLLPALPEAWPIGKVTGLRARGGFTVDIEWREGKLEAARIRSLLGRPAAVRYGGKVIRLETSSGATYRLDGRLHDRGSRRRSS